MGFICAVLLLSTGTWLQDITYAGEWDRPAGCVVRLVAAEGRTDPTRAGRRALTIPQRMILAFMPLERSARAVPSTGEMYSEKFLFVVEGKDDAPIADFPYFITSEGGLAVYGRTAENGCTARVYTPSAERLSCETSEEAVIAREGDNRKRTEIRKDAPQGGENPTSGEAGTRQLTALGFSVKVCFICPEALAPVPRYPYFVASERGYAMAGRAGEDGCTPEFFTFPLAKGFTVYGGEDAIMMNTNGSGD